MRPDLIHFASDVDPSETIPGFFSGQHIFITGGSGFMGKVLIEKLLRTCPDIGTIYILLRPKFGQQLQERIDAITANVLFDKLKQQNEKALGKIVPILGDVRQLQLGMSEEDRQTLIDNVSIVYHIAATVRFDETLADSIIMNTRGTREVCDLVLSLKNVTAFLHVSTAYCQHDKKIIEEIVYEPHTDWRKMIKIVENTDQYVMKIISGKIMDGFPNTYTLSKALAEAVVADMCGGKVPTIIFRPTIVIPCYMDPLPGWVDNMNGPVGIVIASGKGVIRSLYVNVKAKMDIIPVDTAINSMVKATWIQKYLDNQHISVYNCSSSDILNITVVNMQKLGSEFLKTVTPRLLWYPNLSSTDNKFIHLFKVYLYQLLPAIIIDLVLKCLKNPLRLVKIQRRIFLALGHFAYFLQNGWIFKNDKFMELDDYLHEKDRDHYFNNIRDLDPLELFNNGAKIVLQLILKEDVSRNQDMNFRILQCMEYTHKTMKLVFSILIIRYLFNNLMVPVCDHFINYLSSL